MFANIDQRLITWTDPKYEVPEDGDRNIMVIVTGECYHVHFDKALLIGYYSKDEGWIIEGWEEMKEFTIHAWAEVEFPDLGE